MRNALAHAGKSGRRVVSAFIATAFAQDDADAARLQWRKVTDQLRAEIAKLGDVRIRLDDPRLASRVVGMEVEVEISR